MTEVAATTGPGPGLGSHCCGRPGVGGVTVAAAASHTVTVTVGHSNPGLPVRLTVWVQAAARRPSGELVLVWPGASHESDLAALVTVPAGRTGRLVT